MPRRKVSDVAPEDRILIAARKLFFKHGFSAVTTRMLANEANVSKATLYDRFPDKEKLLVAVVEEENKKYFDLNSEVPDDKEAYIDSIFQFGLSILNLIDKPDILKFDQLMLSQVVRHRKITRLYYQKTYEAAFKHLETMIAKGQSFGFIKNSEQPGFLADMLISSWEGRTYQRALYGLKASRHEDPQKYVRKIMSIILGI